MLNKKYREIALAVFNGNSDTEICQRNKISHSHFVELFGNDDFCKYMELLHKKETLQTQCHLIRHSISASDRLVKLLEHDKDDTARKAAVDILTKCIDNTKTTKSACDDKPQNNCDISDEQAIEMLSILAKGINSQDSLTANQPQPSNLKNSTEKVITTG